MLSIVGVQFLSGPVRRRSFFGEHANAMAQRFPAFEAGGDRCRKEFDESARSDRYAQRGATEID